MCGIFTDENLLEVNAGECAYIHVRHTCKPTCLKSNVIVCVVFAHAHGRACKFVETPKVFSLHIPCLSMCIFLAVGWQR